VVVLKQTKPVTNALPAIHRNWYQTKNGIPHAPGSARLKNGNHKAPAKGTSNKTIHHLFGLGPLENFDML
jgi:hypothetical protein